MRTGIILMILLFPALAFGQVNTTHIDKSEAEEKIFELVATWSLGLNNEGEAPADIRSYNKFVSLFDSNATIINDINAIYFPASSNDPHPYKTNSSPVSVESYAHNVVLQFKNLNVDTLYIRYNLDSINNDVVNVTLRKTVSGEKRRQYVFDDTTALANNLIKYKTEKYGVEKIDTSGVIAAINKLIANGNQAYLFTTSDSVEIRLVKKDNTVKISSIRILSIIDTLSCNNDSDNDGVLENEDCDKGKQGDITALGCIDNDLDGVRDGVDKCPYIFGDSKNEGCPLTYFTTRFELSGVLSLQWNSADMSMPELDKLGYESIDPSLSARGSLQGKSIIQSYPFSIGLTYFFSRNKRMGIYLGADIASYKATYTVNDPAVYTFRSNDGSPDDYRRRITLHAGSSETINHSVLNFPLLFTYRYRPGKLTKRDQTIPNWFIEFSAGPSLIMLANTSDYNSNIDFEGLYQVDTLDQHAFTYYDTFDPGSTWNVWLTADKINAQSESPGATTVFALLDSAGYDFAVDKNYNGKENSSTSSFALNAKLDMCYKFNDRDRFALKFGVSATIATLPNHSNGYTLIDKTTDPYNSIYNSQPGTIYLSYGLHLGFIWQW